MPSKRNSKKHPPTIPTPIIASPHPIVGIGASAGGLLAFERFFSGLALNSEPGMAFVLLQHLAPDHKSILSELLQSHTTMPVSEISDGMLIHANCVYVAPPNYNVALLNGRLQLLARDEIHTRRLPIDFFFQSLAQDQGENAIAIILSGMGSDGTQGIIAIKEASGLVIAQTPDSSECDGMT